MGDEVSRLLRDWLAFYDPIHRGWTRAGIANGVCATAGFSFPRIRGGYNLYRTIGGLPENEEALVGAASADASRIRTFSWVGHVACGEYIYRLVPVSGGGVENRVDVTQAVVRFSAGGQWMGGLPNAPTDPQLIPLSHGRMAFRWSYFPQGQEVEPKGFNLYTGAGGDIDYGSLRTVVSYQPGQVHYEYVTMPEADGARVAWAVRAYAPSMWEEQNCRRAFGVARSEGPPANPEVRITLV